MLSRVIRRSVGDQKPQNTTKLPKISLYGLTEKKLYPLYPNPSTSNFLPKNRQNSCIPSCILAVSP
jgi:hypothetical protein